MAKEKKSQVVDHVSASDGAGVIAGVQKKVEVVDRDRLFDLYVARVAKAETVQTMRRDATAIFRESFAEAWCALQVYRDCVNQYGDKLK